MRQKLKSNSKKDAGHIVVALAGSLLAFCGILGMAMDIAYLSWQTRQMQGAADSAAIAGAYELLRGHTGLTESAARADSGMNGYTNGVDTVTVTPNWPPASGDHSGNLKYVEALVARAAPTFFMKVLGTNSVALQTRAVAGLTGEPNCIYALASSGTDTLNVNGNSTINIPCGVAVDSTDTQTITGGNVDAQLNASSVSLSAAGYSGHVMPTPVLNAVPAGDPLGYLTAPAVGACTAPTVGGINTSITPCCLALATPVTIDPGVYCGGITATAGVLTLNPGLYILKGGGLTTSSSVTLNGNGVTFYNTFDGTHAYAPIASSGSGTINLAAPTTGAWAGMLFFSDRNAPASTNSTNINSFSGNGQVTLTGTLYFLTQKVTFSGGISGTAVYTNIVAWKIIFAGNMTLNHDVTVLPDGSPLKKVVLVE